MTTRYTYARQLAALTADTAKAQSTDFLAADFQLRHEGALCRVTIAVSTAVVVLLVPSSGTAIALNGGSALTAGGLHTFELALDTGRTWNVQTSDAAGTTCRHLVVHELA